MCIRDRFNLIGEAEGALHGEDPGDVHLHELGTIDTLIDVAGVVLGLEMMSLEKLYCSPLPTGSGTVKTQHGLLPVPAPATAFMMAAKRYLVILRRHIYLPQGKWLPLQVWRC